jgi:hypothetical protein
MPHFSVFSAQAQRELKRKYFALFSFQSPLFRKDKASDPVFMLDLGQKKLVNVLGFKNGKVF